PQPAWLQGLRGKVLPDTPTNRCRFGRDRSARKVERDGSRVSHSKLTNSCEVRDDASFPPARSEPAPSPPRRPSQPFRQRQPDVAAATWGASSLPPEQPPCHELGCTDEVTRPAGNALMCTPGFTFGERLAGRLGADSTTGSL